MRLRVLLPLITLLASEIAGARPAQAADPSVPPAETRETAGASDKSGAQDTATGRFKPRLPVMIVAGTAYIVSDLLKKNLAPDNCHWCDRNPDGTENLNSLDASARRHLRWSNTNRAGVISSVLGFGVAPASALGLTWLAARDEGRGGEFWPNTVIIMESAFLAADATQIAKFTTKRARPFVHDLTDPSNSVDSNLSFFSGHTSITFALAVSAGEVASRRGYHHLPLIWGSGLAIAATTGYLRIAADKHYLTDVLAGAAVGSFVGWAVPNWLHHGPPADANEGDQGVRVVPVVGPETVGLGLNW